MVCWHVVSWLSAGWAHDVHAASHGSYFQDLVFRTMQLIQCRLISAKCNPNVVSSCVPYGCCGHQMDYDKTIHIITETTQIMPSILTYTGTQRHLDVLVSLIHLEEFPGFGSSYRLELTGHLKEFPGLTKI